MQRFKGLVVMLLVLLVGCQIQQPPATTAAATTAAPYDTSRPHEFRLTEMENTPGYGEVVGIVTISGILKHTKGLNGFIGEMLIPATFLEGNHSSGWKPEYAALVGKVVEAHGEHYRYHCGPMEQCLGAGIINSLRDISYLRAKE